MTAEAGQRLPVAMPWHAVRQIGRRLSWSLSDQAMASLSNFLMSLYIARVLGAPEFGAFSLAYVTYGFAANASRGVSIEPLLIRFSGTDVTTWRRATAGSTGTALLTGIVSGACALGVGMIVGHTTGNAFLALGLTFPGLLLQDSWRYAFFALGRGYHAFVNDAIWAVVEIPLLVLLKLSGHANVLWFVLAWGFAGSAASAFGILQARVIPSLPLATKWLVQHKDLGPRYLVENSGGNAADTLRSYSTSSILGVTSIGYIQAANMLMGPFRIISYGVGMFTIPEASRILRHSPRRLPLFCLAISVGLSIVALVWGGVLLVAMSYGAGYLILGQLWRETYPLVPWATLYVMAGCAALGATVGLHALGAARRSLRAVLLNSALILIFAIAGAKFGGMQGTMRAAAIISWVGALVAWWQLRQGLHDSRAVRVPGWMLPRPSGRHHRSHQADSPRPPEERLAHPRRTGGTSPPPGGFLHERGVHDFYPLPPAEDALPPVAEQLVQNRNPAPQ